MVLQGVINGLLAEEPLDRIAQRVRELPRELEELFESCLNTILCMRYESDVQMAARTLLLITASLSHLESRPLFLIHYSFLDDYRDVNFAIKLPKISPDHEAVRRRVRRARKRLAGLCLGLVETFIPKDREWLAGPGLGGREAMSLNSICSPTERVRPVHRAVYDFLSQARILRVLRSRSANFNISEFNLQAYLGFLKTIPTEEGYFRVSFQWDLRCLLFDSLVRVGRPLDGMALNFLDSITATLECQTPASLAITVDTPAFYSKDNICVEISARPVHAVPLIAASVGLVEYLESETGRACIDAIGYGRHHNPRFDKVCRPSIQLVLRPGQSPPDCRENRPCIMFSIRGGPLR